jgi:hypothetical protein
VKRIFSAMLVFGVLGQAHAGTITITKPNSGDFLGLSNQISFNITGANTQVTVRAVATQVSDPTVQVSVENEFTPGTDNKINGTLNLNFTSGFPSGAYNLNITATEPGAVYNVLPVIPVTVDVTEPKFLFFNPISSRFIRGTVPISALFQETNMKEWRVQVNNADIPNNTGDTLALNVNWNSDLELADGAKTISIRAEDKAGNSKSESINVTLDRLPPSATVLAPNSSDRYFGNARVPVVVDIVDQFANALDERTIDVVIRDAGGNFITRVARRSIRPNGNTITWTGRIRDISVLPTVFDIVVLATDKAGNAATNQVIRIDRTRVRTSGRQAEAASETVVDKAVQIRRRLVQFGKN